MFVVGDVTQNILFYFCGYSLFNDCFSYSFLKASNHEMIIDPVIGKKLHNANSIGPATCPDGLRKPVKLSDTTPGVLNCIGKGKGNVHLITGH
jgi:hypothetical protein